MSKSSAIEHVTLSVASSPGGREFYRSVLAAVGLTEHVDDHGRASYGELGDFGVYHRAERFFEGTHVAFRAASHEAVDRFAEAVLAAGGEVIDAPRERPEFGEGVYSTYVRDPGGNVLEAIFRGAAASEG